MLIIPHNILSMLAEWNDFMDDFMSILSIYCIWITGIRGRDVISYINTSQLQAQVPATTFFIKTSYLFSDFFILIIVFFCWLVILVISYFGDW